MSALEKISRDLPDFTGSNWLLRFPLIIVFIQQGFSKLPIDQAAADIYSLPLIVWVMAAWGEIFSGLGLLFGGILNGSNLFSWLGDLVTRVSGLVILIIMIGVINTTEPESIIDIFFMTNFTQCFYLEAYFLH